MIGKINNRILAILIVLLMIAVAFTFISTAQDTPSNGDDDDLGETMTDIDEKSVVPNPLGKPPIPRCSLDSGDDDSPGET